VNRAALAIEYGEFLSRGHYFIKIRVAKQLIFKEILRIPCAFLADCSFWLGFYFSLHFFIAADQQVPISQAFLAAFCCLVNGKGKGKMPPTFQGDQAWEQVSLFRQFLDQKDG
jgi:hypothetical protein